MLTRSTCICNVALPYEAAHLRMSARQCRRMLFIQTRSWRQRRLRRRRRITTTAIDVASSNINTSFIWSSLSRRIIRFQPCQLALTDRERHGNHGGSYKNAPLHLADWRAKWAKREHLMRRPLSLAVHRVARFPLSWSSRRRLRPSKVVVRARRRSPTLIPLARARSESEPDDNYKCNLTPAKEVASAILFIAGKSAGLR